MANWIIYPLDRNAQRFTSVQVSATGGAGSATSAANAVRIDPTSLWQPNSTASGLKWYTDLVAPSTGSTHNIRAIGFNNHNFAGLNVVLWDANAFAASAGVNMIDTTFPAGNRDLVINTNGGNPQAIEHFTVQFISSMVSGGYCGSICALDDDEAIEITDGGVFNPVGHPVNLGHASIIAASGAQINQIVGGTRKGLNLQLAFIPTGSGEIGETIWDSLHDLDGWAHGVWVTDTAFGTVANQGRGYYCDVIGPIDTGITDAGNRAVFSLQLLEKSKGVKGAF